MDPLPPFLLNGLWIRIFKWLPGCRSHYWHPWRHSRRIHPHPQLSDPHSQALHRWRPVAVGVLVCFTWLTLEPWHYLLWWHAPGTAWVAQAASPTAPAPEAQLAQFLKDLEQQGRRLDEKVAKGQDASVEANWFGQAASTLASLHGQMQGRFKEIEKQIAALPAEIHLRHQQAVLKYEQNIPLVQQALQAIVSEATPSGKAAKSLVLADLLQQLNPQPQPIPLDPNNLPVRSPEATPIPPRLTPAEYALTEGVKLASADTQGILLAQATTSPPTAADLAETIEVQFTPEIRAKAQELGNNPVKIYNWVRNTIEFVPTYGSIQGAQMCLLTRQCNAFDTASLLIALLRVSGIHARYEYGTIEVPIDKVMNWVGGTTTEQAAVNVLASGGIPVKGVVSGGKITKVQMEHLWIRAWIDYIPSRGAVHKQGDTWVPLDPSFKQYEYHAGIDLSAIVSLDAQALHDQALATATYNPTERYLTNVDPALVQQTLRNAQATVLNYLNQQLPNATVADVIGKKAIIPHAFPFLVGTLPHKLLIRGAQYSALPTGLRHAITITLVNPKSLTLDPDISYRVSLPELAGKRVAFNYVPATPTDQQMIDNLRESYATSIPAYLVQLKPTLKVEDAVVAQGPATPMGIDETLSLTFQSPGRSTSDTYRIVAGDHSVIGFNLASAREDFEARIARPFTSYAEPVSEMLHQTLLGYWTEVDVLRPFHTRAHGVVAYRLPSAGLAAATLHVTSLFGIPTSAYYSERGLDIRRSHLLVVSKDGDPSRARTFNQSIGIVNSLFEGLIFDQLFGIEPGDGLSTISLLELANAQGIPIYEIDASNVTTVLPTLQVSGAVLTDIRNGVGAGKIAIVPQRPLSHQGWVGVGYIIYDPVTGDGAYQIDGGTAGSTYISTAKTVEASGDVPYSLGVVVTVQAWRADVGAAVLEDIAAALGPRVAGLLQALKITALILILTIIIAAAIDIIVKHKPPANFKEFRHYTTYEGRAGIIASKVIKRSDSGDLGPGAYVTDYFEEPDNGGPASERIAAAINKYPATLIQTYVILKIDLNRRPLVNGASIKAEWRWQWVYQNLPLPIDGKTVILVQ